MNRVMLICLCVMACETNFPPEFCASNPNSPHCGATTDILNQDSKGETTVEIDGSTDDVSPEIADNDIHVIDLDDSPDTDAYIEVEEPIEEVEIAETDDGDSFEITEIETIDVIVECTVDNDCIPLLTLAVCEVPYCNSGTCEVATAPNSTLCTDNDQCTSDDQCSNGTCSGIFSCECETTNDCQNDANACNGVYTCENNLCIIKESSIVVCTTTDGCLELTCNPVSGLCEETDKDCDDHVACTLDSCEQGSCIHKVDNTPCIDTDECTTDVCTATGCTNTFTPALLCNDSDSCTLGDICADNTCKGEEKSCDDSNVCTTDTCNNGTCANTPTAGICSDNSNCTTNDHCESGFCLGTNVPTCVCATNNDCAPLDDDQNRCNGTFVCVETVCVFDAKEVVCTPTGTSCTFASCNANTGLCEINPVNEQDSCATLDPCILNSVCSNGVCTGNVDACDDGNICTDDSCETGVGCQHTATTDSCNDGNPCTEEDICADEICSGTIKNCDDTFACTNDFCEEGFCTHTVNHAVCPDGVQCLGGYCDVNSGCIFKENPNGCNDNNVCTSDECTAPTGCIHTPIAGTCNDDNACTTNDACVDGSCAGVNACDDKNPCTTDSCNNGCVNTPLNCDDGHSCTNDTCNDGSCSNTPIPNACTDDNPCTSDLCSTENGCTYITNSGNSCNDSDSCTISDTCVNGTCKGLNTCECEVNADCASKDDGNKCNGVFVCESHTCVFDEESVVLCDKNQDTFCIESACQPSNGACTYNAIHNLEPCDDNNACTTDDYCDNGACVPFIPVSCNDFNDCTKDTCDEATGCDNAPQNFATCDDANSATVFDACKQDVCDGVLPFKETFEEVTPWEFSSTNLSFGDWKFLVDPEGGSSPSPTKSLQYKSQAMTLTSPVTATTLSPIIEIPHSSTPTLTFYRAGSMACAHGNVQIIIEDVVLHEACGSSSSWQKIEVPLPTTVSTTRVRVQYNFTAGAKPAELWYRFDLFESHP